MNRWLLRRLLDPTHRKLLPAVSFLVFFAPVLVCLLLTGVDGPIMSVAFLVPPIILIVVGFLIVIRTFGWSSPLSGPATVVILSLAFGVAAAMGILLENSARAANWPLALRTGGITVFVSLVLFAIGLSFYSAFLRAWRSDHSQPGHAEASQDSASEQVGSG